MKRLLTSLLLTLPLASFAFNPVNGKYGGVFLGPSYAPSTSFTLPSPATISGPNGFVSFASGGVVHSVLGDVGVQLGYRFCSNFRIEGEAFYNNNHINTVSLDKFSFSVTNPTTGVTTSSSTPTTIIISGNQNNPYIYQQGDTNTGSFMINGFYDFLIPNNDGYSVTAPFVGIGIGYGFVENAVKFLTSQANTTMTNVQFFKASQNRSVLAAQAIVGVNYFMDDFTWFDIDVRYWATQKSNPITTYTLTAPGGTTATYKSSVNPFGKDAQLISVNLSFNGVFDFD